MGTKYYSHFVVRSKETGEAEEYGGVLEMNLPMKSADTDDIKEILARNLDLDVENIQLIDWARLH